MHTRVSGLGIILTVYVLVAGLLATVSRLLQARVHSSLVDGSFPEPATSKERTP